MEYDNADNKIYIGYWWEFLTYQATFGSAKKLQGHRGNFKFPVDLELFPAFSFDSGNKPSNLSRARLSYTLSNGLMLNENNPAHEAAIAEITDNFLQTFEQWMLRNLASDNLAPSDLTKLFISKHQKIFISEDELEEMERADLFLEKQRVYFTEFLGYTPRV